jgi:hypothetical protein
MQELWIVTTAENRDLKASAAASLRATWPEFVLHDAVSVRARLTHSQASDHTAACSTSSTATSNRTCSVE